MYVNVLNASIMPHLIRVLEAPVCPRQIPGKLGYFPKVSDQRRRYKKHIDETLWYLMHRAVEALNTEVCYCYYNFTILEF